ncbi:MAG: alanine:cation symporter family protein, partial [Desulfuromonadales bacterium]|nr:alanine:cation symporter family protein [Desulfuromonadales bacterium]
ALESSWGVPSVATGLVLAVMTGVVIIGGIKRIGKVTEKLVPAMALFYFVGALVIIVMNIGQLPAAFGLIFSHAFAPASAAGGFAGATVSAAMRFGVERGIFSNEAGLGSAPIAHAAARTNNPVRQGLVAMTGVFFDTIIVCTMTALVILMTGAWTSGETSSALTQLAFDTGLPGAGSLVVTLGLAVFAYSTMIGWSYYGEECIEYLFGLKARTPYRYVFCLVIFVGAFLKVSLVWDFSGAMNGCMAIPNLIGLLALSGVLAKVTREKLAKE